MGITGGVFRERGSVESQAGKDILATLLIYQTNYRARSLYQARSQIGLALQATVKLSLEQVSAREAESD